ncbi:MAG: hypothetical protein ACREBS_08425, partial [Nitrososphaerales archaeon]
VTAAGAGAPNVAITQSASGAGPVGAPLTYTVTPANGAAAPISNVWIIDPLGPNEAFLSASDTAGTTFT